MQLCILGEEIIPSPACHVPLDSGAWGSMSEGQNEKVQRVIKMEKKERKEREKMP